MTLFKQIALLVSTMFLLLASIIVINDLKRTGTFMQGQLQTTAQDMTTTLGIAIGNLPSAADQATLEVLFNSVFDSGYYSSIKLVAVDGSIIHEKSQQLNIDGIPEWFLQLVSLSPAQGSTQVMQGWSQLGQLTLILHPGYAYSGLYDSLLSTLKWFVLIFACAIIVLWLLLHYLLLPLQRVKEQADSIHKNKFVQQDKLPATSELKSVVKAMNDMVSKVQSVFSDQENTIGRYHKLLYTDKLTGLANRRFMLDHLNQALSQESSFHGSLGVIKLVNFDQLRERQGYQVSDELIQQLALMLNDKHADLSAEKIARLSDEELSFLIAADDDSVVEFIQSIFTEIKKLPDFNKISEDCFVVAGVSAIEEGFSTGDLLSGIDYCLSLATSEGPFAVEQKVSTNLDLPKGQMQWRSWLDDILRDERFFLVGQSAVDQDKSAVQKELFIRAKNEQGQIIPASAFMPMASRLGLAIEIDKAVFKLVSSSSTTNIRIPLAVNLSASFFELVEAQKEFNQLLQDSRTKGLQLCIEASHHILNQHPEMCNQISERVKKHGHQFGLDNFDLSLSLQLLKSTQFDYIKINAKTLSDMDSEESTSGYQALKTLTNTLDIQVIAVAVDSEMLFNQLQKMGIQVMQGNYLNESELVTD